MLVRYGGTSPTGGPSTGGGGGASRRAAALFGFGRKGKEEAARQLSLDSAAGLLVAARAALRFTADGDEIHPLRQVSAAPPPAVPPAARLTSFPGRISASARGPLQPRRPSYPCPPQPTPRARRPQRVRGPHAGPRGPPPGCRHYGTSTAGGWPSPARPGTCSPSCCGCGRTAAERRQRRWRGTWRGARRC